MTDEQEKRLRETWKAVDEGYDCGCSQPCACPYLEILTVLAEIFGEPIGRK